LLLEQNSIPGRSTRWLSRWADSVCLSYPESAKYFSKRTPTHLTGNPVRREIAHLTGDDKGQDELTSKPPTLLILGGSQGAQSLNEGMLWLLRTNPRVLAGWRIVHQTGTTQQAVIQAGYHDLGISAEVSAFLPDMAERYAASTLVISRAGATTLAELACAGLPAILVPYPFAADNHQWHNARTFEVAGAAVTALQGDSVDATGKILLDRLEQLLKQPDRVHVMSRAMRRLAKPDATESVLQVLSKLVRK
jgi:UDP-N-acetylglucosamine--N-acetylmuramyl-(pentapeptide) pyrophosphoryl-undecaprenol N-acetylglucosamine transferase